MSRVVSGCACEVLSHLLTCGFINHMETQSQRISSLSVLIDAPLSIDEGLHKRRLDMFETLLISQGLILLMKESGHLGDNFGGMGEKCSREYFVRYGPVDGRFGVAVKLLKLITVEPVAIITTATV